MSLDPEQSAFVQTGVAIEVASRDVHNVPSVARAIAARVSPDRRSLTLFVPRTYGARCLTDVEATGAVAATFCRATTLQTIQIKGSDARVGPAAPEDLPYVMAMVNAFVADLRAIGHSPLLGALDTAFEPDDLMAVTFTPAAAFVQTPGPAAGSRL